MQEENLQADFMNGSSAEEADVSLNLSCKFKLVCLPSPYQLLTTQPLTTEHHSGWWPLHINLPQWIISCYESVVICC